MTVVVIPQIIIIIIVVVVVFVISVVAIAADAVVILRTFKYLVGHARTLLDDKINRIHRVK